MPEEMIKVASKSPLAVRLFEAVEVPEVDGEKKPGLAPPARSFVVAGAHTGEGFSMVPADLYRKWIKANPHHPLVLNDMLREVSDDEDATMTFGFQPALDAIVGDKDNTEAAKKGVEVREPTKPAPVAPNMDAHSSAPNDDSPRSRAPMEPVDPMPAQMSDVELEHATRPDRAPTKA